MNGQKRVVAMPSNVEISQDAPMRAAPASGANGQGEGQGEKSQIPLRRSQVSDPLTQEELLSWYRLAALTRKMDERASVYARRGMGWSYHARCAGQEGIQLALGLSFKAGRDFLFPYYRDLGTALAAGMKPVEILYNGLSKDADPGSGGRHMSHHFAKPEIGIQNVSSCTGNHTLHAVGVARAIKTYDGDGIAFSSQGESSVSEGYCFEAFNGASREKLPVCFVIQNNGYGISVPVWQQTANACVADNFVGLKHLHIVRCDGTDLFDSIRAMKEAVDHIRSGAGPAMVHATCVRIGAHSNSDAHELYRSAEEIAEVARFDPVARFAAHLTEREGIVQAELDAIDQALDQELDAAAEEAESAPVPSPESVSSFVVPPAYDPTSEGLSVSPPEGAATEKLREAINRTLHEEFRRNPHTFLWGQDVASRDKGGVFNLTKGLLAEFGPKRVFNAPIAEDFIVGTANGMSRYRKDIRVVIEAAQFADYVWPAMEQVVEMSHDYWRSKGQFSPNVVLRLASGGYITGGLYHSQNIEAIMAHLPGLRVVYPAYADDASGLLRTAIRSEGMTFFLEPKYLYNRGDAKGPPTDPDFTLPFGKGRIRRSGEDLSVITYGNTVHLCLKAAEKLADEGIDVEVFDLRSLKPLDEAGIVETVARTGKALVVHEDHLFGGLGGEVAALISERCFMDLDGPVRRLAAKDVPIGFAKSLEDATLPQLADIEVAMRDLANF
jgi:2-oxoisovalerate dehydrogenase E1 component